MVQLDLLHLPLKNFFSLRHLVDVVAFSLPLQSLGLRVARRESRSYRRVYVEVNLDTAASEVERGSGVAGGRCVEHIDECLG